MVGWWMLGFLIEWFVINMGKIGLMMSVVIMVIGCDILVNVWMVKVYDDVLFFFFVV